MNADTEGGTPAEAAVGGPPVSGGNRLTRSVWNGDDVPETNDRFSADGSREATLHRLAGDAKYARSLA